MLESYHNQPGNTGLRVQSIVSPNQCDLAICLAFYFKLLVTHINVEYSVK